MADSALSNNGEEDEEEEEEESGAGDSAAEANPREGAGKRKGEREKRCAMS